MKRLQFPTEEIVGTLDWRGVPHDGGPVLATGLVEVPEGVEVRLTVEPIDSIERRDHDASAGGGGIVTRIGPEGARRTHVTEARTTWVQHVAPGRRVHLRFLDNLPEDAITDLRLIRRASVVAESLTALSHLSPGLRRLYLGRTDLSDEVLPWVAHLKGLVYLQTWGNRFTDVGVQQLVALQSLEQLYLEDENLSPAAFDFAERLPHLVRLGFADEWPAGYKAAVRARFPRVAAW